MSSSLLRRQGDLLCAKGCGFYGNPEWKWHCSKCWREVKGEQKQKHQDRRNLPLSQEVRQTTVPDRGQKKYFREKKKVSSPPSEPNLPPESKLVRSEFAAFLSSRLDRQGVVQVSRQTKTLIDKIQAEAEGAEVENCVQEFYRQFDKLLQVEPAFKGLTDTDRDQTLDWCEKYALVCCYKDLFCPANSQDEEKDLQLQNRIRRLNWITMKQLGCVISESNQQVRDQLHQSITQLLEMDSKMAPGDKLSSLVECCKSIFEMLRLSNQEHASADEFLPSLIYVCLKSNPPRMHSNINFITRFRNEERLRMGEDGYFFANLCCAISFIEDMTADSINMDPEEFSNYVSGSVVPPGSWQASLLMCESLQVMGQNQKQLSDVRKKQEKLLREAKALESTMSLFEKDISSEIQAVLSMTQYKIKHTVEEELAMLPEPILPRNVPLTYEGLSAQNTSIPNIACDNVVERD